MFDKKEILSPERAVALQNLRAELQTWLFTTYWKDDERDEPYAPFSGKPADLLLLTDDLSECGWRWSFFDPETLRISPDDIKPSSEILPTPAEVEVYCKNHEILRNCIKNIHPDPSFSNGIEFSSETPERVMNALVAALEDLGWNVERDGEVRLLIRQK